MKEIFKFISDKNNVNIIAEEIVNIFVSEANRLNVEYDFDISKENGSIIGSKNNANTLFSFDTTEGTKIDEFKKCMFNEDLNEIEENNKEYLELMEKERNFIVDVCDKINEKYFDRIKEVIRNVVLGNKASGENIPLNEIKIISIDIADYSSIPKSAKYLLKIFKKDPKDIKPLETDEIIEFIQEREEKTGMDASVIAEIEIKSGNPLFSRVSSVSKGRKFLNDIVIYLFVDYSFKNE